MSIEGVFPEFKFRWRVAIVGHDPPALHRCPKRAPPRHPAWHRQTACQRRIRCRAGEHPRASNRTALPGTKAKSQKPAAGTAVTLPRELIQVELGSGPSQGRTRHEAQAFCGRADHRGAEGARGRLQDSRPVPQTHGIAEQTSYNWKAKYGGLEGSEARRLKALEDDRRCRKSCRRADCPDSLVSFPPESGYGLRVHDGGSASVRIAFCPWCGRKILS